MGPDPICMAPFCIILCLSAQENVLEELDFFIGRPFIGDTYREVADVAVSFAKEEICVQFLSVYSPNDVWLGLV